MNSPLPNDILDKALELAQADSWESFNLATLAEALHLPLAELSQRFRSKDDLAEALFDRADQAMLRQVEHPGFTSLPAEERLALCLMAWLETLAPYRPVVREILAYKLEPGHVHLQAHGITRISRTVQWLLTAAEWRLSGPRRVLTEIGVTSGYLMTFCGFLLAPRFDQAATHKRLITRLRPLAPRD